MKSVCVRSFRCLQYTSKICRLKVCQDLGHGELALAIWQNQGSFEKLAGSKLMLKTFVNKLCLRDWVPNRPLERSNEDSNSAILVCIASGGQISKQAGRWRLKSRKAGVIRHGSYTGSIITVSLIFPNTGSLHALAHAYVNSFGLFYQRMEYQAR